MYLLNFNKTSLIAQIEHIEAVEAYACRHLLSKVIMELGYTPNDHTLRIRDLGTQGVAEYTLEVFLNETGEMINARKIDSLEASLLKRIGVSCS